MIEEYNHGKEFPTLKSVPGLRFRKRVDPRESSKSTTRVAVMHCSCSEMFKTPVLTVVHREVKGQGVELQAVRVSISEPSAGLDSATAKIT